MPIQHTLVSQFLRAHRDALQPEDVGLPRSAGRRVCGLRREEVASLACISLEYYLRLEQGIGGYPSDRVVTSLAQALLLDDDEVDYLRRIVRQQARVVRAPVMSELVDAGVSDVINQWEGSPAIVLDRNQDVVAANSLARELGGGSFDPGQNRVLATFSVPPRHRRPQWEATARSVVAALRFHGDADDLRMQRIVGKLWGSSSDFRRIWALQDARAQSAGSVECYIETFGRVDFRCQFLAVPGISHHVVMVLFADPGSVAGDTIELVGARKGADYGEDSGAGALSSRYEKYPQAALA
ncbi:helix-turn-helix transcriptional regulator [Lacisediminihabitans changchengi]|uniref:Helix-turn-helix domain-containing protein n=1 Tax=Lacisediminihabitans changchengi TaxID=2787634 RepID=A0A934SVI2_9MICO|nr:helix-turn-helix transcriptional regulator [Lacisediminihabitans changchengi]MBK4348794.1 helix-turn-helix domain-containing protein [Lacisediminihabitans changchengi]